jgi:hypothetical protein
MVNAYLRSIDAQETRAGTEGIDGTTRCGPATCGAVLWRAELASPIATARTVQNQTPKQGWSFR